MFNKNKTIKVNNEELVGMTEEPVGMTYVDVASQELNRELNKLIEVKERIKSLTNEIIADIKENGESHLLIIKFHELLEKEKNNDKEIIKTKREHAVDSELLVLAQSLDRADMENKGMDLIRSIVPKINDILFMLPEIEKCYGNELYQPHPLIAIKRSMQGLPLVLNANLPRLVKVDKAALIQKFNERLKAVEAKRTEAQVMGSKYIL